MADTKVSLRTASNKAFGSDFNVGNPTGRMGGGIAAGGKSESYNPNAGDKKGLSNTPPATHGRKGDGRK